MSPDAAARSTIDIEVVLATPERQQRIELAVPRGCTAREAVRLARGAGLDTEAAPDLDADRGPLGVFGEHVPDERVLEAGDRVELYRPLVQDPRERRRRRAAAAETARSGVADGRAVDGRAAPRARRR